MKRPIGVIAASVVCLLWSGFAFLMGLAVMWSAFVPAAPTAPPMPKTFALGVGATILALSALGVVTAIELFRLRPWARMSILIFSGIAAPMCFLTVALGFFIPLPAAAPISETTLRGIVIGLYAVPLLITCWWLAQFTSQTTKAAFMASAQSRPLIVLIIGWGNLIGGIVCIIPVLMGLPAFVLGFVFRGVAAQAFYVLFGALSAHLGWSLLKLQERARVFTLGWFGLIALNSAYVMFSPAARTRMLEMQAQIDAQPTAPELDMMAFLIASSVATLVLLAIGAWLLVRAKPAFVSSAAPTEAPPASTPAAG